MGLKLPRVESDLLNRTSPPEGIAPIADKAVSRVRYLSARQQDLYSFVFSFPSASLSGNLVTRHSSLVTSLLLFPDIADAVAEPACRDNFLLGVELNSFLAL